MNVDCIFETMNRHGVRYLLIGGMNFMLRHEPVLTYDVDLWIEDTEANRRRCEAALVELEAEWGPSEQDWQPVKKLGDGWLDRQTMFCFAGPHGALDIFRTVAGLSSWRDCWNRSLPEVLSSGTRYHGLADEDMLLCRPCRRGKKNIARAGARKRNQSPQELAIMTPQEKLHEEQKRERCWEPVTRWKVLQDTIAFVDSQQKVPRNSKESCLMRQRKFDEQFRKSK